MALPTDPTLPLADLKVLDFSWAGVGPITVKYLADHGATVLRVESHARYDVVRLGPPWHDGKPGIERSQFYASYNTSKLGIGLDLSKPEARAIARRLAAWADVVVESYTPRVMRAFGLAYEDLRAVNPHLVMLSTCLQGQTGPYAEFPGFGQLAAALSGFYEIAGWADRAPAPPYGAYTDYVVPRLAATALLAAVDQQRRTGEGQHLDVSQVEAALHFLAPALLDHELTGRVATRAGNRSDHAAPHGAYPCAGDDRWIALSVRGEAEWRALCAVLAQPASRTPRRSTRSWPRRRAPSMRASSWAGCRRPGSRPASSRARSTCTPIPCSPAGASSSGSSIRRARRRPTRATRCAWRRRRGNSAGRRRRSASTPCSCCARCSA